MGNAHPSVRAGDRRDRVISVIREGSGAPMGSRRFPRNWTSCTNGKNRLDAPLKITLTSAKSQADDN